MRESAPDRYSKNGKGKGCDDIVAVEDVRATTPWNK